MSEFRADNCTDWAAALTYYGVLSLFPAILSMVSLISLVGDPKPTTETLLKIADALGPQSAVDTFAEPVRQIAQAGSSSGIVFVVGLVGALWAASGYVGAFGRALNAIYEVEEGRPFWKLRPLQAALTLTCVVLAALVTLGLVFTGPLAQAVGDSIGLGTAAVTVWNVGKWPLMVMAVCTILMSLFYVTPNIRQPRWVWLAPGAVLALVVWCVASVGFAFYVAHFGSYNATFGSLGAVVVFLIWLWLTNCAILLGAELNAELERGRELVAGISDAEQEIQLPPRTPHKAERAS
ncbi:MAG: YihY/virulence factor BrkB family protein [Actinomycetes bacterium]